MENKIINKISEKIKKLLSLATSSNENEAKLASEKANELLIKHNLNMSELKEESNYKNNRVVEGRQSVEDKFICNILQKHFFIQIVKSKGGLHFLGEETNVEIAEYMYDYLKNTFKACFKQYREETGSKVGAKQSYYMGLYKGLNEQLTIKRQNVENETGLVVVKDGELTKYMRDQFGRLRGGGNQRINAGDQAARESGQEKGATMRIRKGLNSSTGSTGKAIAM